MGFFTFRRFFFSMSSNYVWILSYRILECVNTFTVHTSMCEYFHSTYVLEGMIEEYYRVFQNKRSWHCCVVRAMREFLHSRRGSAVFCVPCGFCSGGCQNTWTRLTCNMYNLEQHVFFVKSYYSTHKNLKEVLHLYGEQFNVLRNNWPSKSVIIT